jgi:hypothetical protein
MIIIAFAVVCVFATATGLGSPARPAIVFSFLLVCPGLAFVRLLRIQGPLIELTLAIALSIALDVIVAEAMVLTRQWSPELGVTALAGLSVTGAVVQIRTAVSPRSTQRVLP